MTTAANQEYNGWPNRETWAMALHLGNEEYLYEECNRLAEMHPNKFRLADELKTWVEGSLTIHTTEEATQFSLNLMNDVGSFWRIEWESIAEAYLEEVE